jgi:cytochrome c biogenesis protein CcdA
MKTLIKNSNPFILLLIPVLFAVLMGVGYKSGEKIETAANNTVHATSLFYKGVTLVKTVCSIAKQNVW